MISEGLIKLCLFSSDFFFIKAYDVGTHLHCIDKSIQFQWVPTTYAFTKNLQRSSQSTTAVI